MKRDNGTLRLSASDLMQFMACPHATKLDLLRLSGIGPKEVEDSDDAALLQKRGDAHEAAYLAALVDQGKSVVGVDTDGIPFAQSVAKTLEALQEGPEIIFQGALEGGMWGGYSDFLERVERPSKLGAYSYAVADTKLKRKPAPGHVLQLVLYSDLLEQVQGLAPEFAHVVLGSGERFTFRLSEYAAYARDARVRLEEFVSDPAETRPIPCATCDLCRWREHCAETWREEDSLFEVAGISKAQVAKLEAQGTSTLQALSEIKGTVSRMAPETLDKLTAQARLQQARKSGPPTHELRPYQPGKGFDLLPRPAEGDLFYDIEGDPHYEEAGADGLEYLHGIWDGETFTAFWSHDRAQEKRALIDLFAYFKERISRNPKARIYHYASYEITALRRLTTQHGVGEDQLDGWLREHRFIDLYSVVRGGVVASERSYSIKSLEAFYDIEREGEVTTAGGSVVAYENWREVGNQEILDEIEDYNRIDCVSTEMLRDWLISIRPDDMEAWHDLVEPDPEKVQVQEEAAQELKDVLEASDLPPERRQLLYDLGVFHWREGKPAAWAVFDAAQKSFEELCDDLDCLAGLRAIGPQEVDKRSWTREYTYPPQETKLRAGKGAVVMLPDGRTVTLSIKSIDRTRRRIALRLGQSKSIDLPERLSLLPDFAINARPIPDAIAAVATDQCGDKANRAADDLLSRNAPRFLNGFALQDDPDGDPVESLKNAVRAMNETVLPVQGPPGTGKTYVTARAILSLVKDGKRVGVASNSHAAIRNVLMGCVDALEEDDLDVTLEDVEIAHKEGQGMDLLPDGYERIAAIKGNQDQRLTGSHVVGGTAWLFSRPELTGTFDYLFVDEAGQVSLANMVAMSNAARNLVLIGDPRQLPQVVQGSHPPPADLSCLDWMLAEHAIVPPDRGIFLSTTRRMHPDLCSYISEQFYEGRLHSHESTETQRVMATALPQTGAWMVPVDHDGCAQECPAEVEAIVQTVETLLGGTWRDKEGAEREIRPSDIIVVAPYNAQVNALSDALPGIRVGTVDRFQGQEAPVALVSMTASSAEETTRGLEFLLSRERLNVAVSRGKALSFVFASPRLTSTPCSTVDQMRLVNTLCALPRWPIEGTAS
ncbi:TM0106 family RecB-like putative nuclease [Leisingera caerulea]|uniref:TM0106 family RecB-like putative nuclease n=1 Tax=Leisingera caerulea TaxID=506591 RepID=UPI0021A8AAD8|nr:TM0106 family RecB-like putative nuclease [Leisingera caerulea]UWQ85010.1 TM0106 family RecB-like putative nuclease [Leisingera caerulea]